MPEYTYKNLSELPQHQQNAEHFIAGVLGQIASQFPGLKLEAVNQTMEDLAEFPGMSEAARLDGDSAMLEELREMDSETERESADSTRVSVTMTGDEKAQIEKAVKLIYEHARANYGKKQFDTGTGPYGPRQGLPKIIGHKPEQEDLPQWERYLGFIFR